jgi:ATP/maltotriose-dependent transcriptional regulator MalT
LVSFSLRRLVVRTTSGALLERESELRSLKAVLEDQHHGRGRLVLVEGPAGAGKSALLRAAVDAARAADLDVLRSRGGELEREQPYGLLRQLLQPALARLEPDARAEILSGTAAPVSRILDLGGDGAMPADGFAAAHAIFWLIAGLAARRPLLIAIDDAHWGDASSLRALEHLARRIDDLGVAVLVSLRPAEPGSPAELLDALRQQPGAVRLAPAPLSADGVTALLAGSWPNLPTELGVTCRQVTGGNPLLLEELLRALADIGETPTTEQVLSASVPTLEERVLRRAQRVSKVAPGFAQAMAVLGSGARLASAAALAGIDETLAGQLAHGLRRIEILATEDPATFVHPLVRQSLYDGIPTAERHRLHARAAELLAADGAAIEITVAHLSVLPPAGSSLVAEGCLGAAESALARAAPSEAVSWLQRALAEGAAQPSRAQLLARQGLALATLRDPSCVPVLSEAYESVEDPGMRRTVAVELAYTLAVSGAWERSAETIDRAERDLRTDPAAVADLAAVRASLELHDARRIASFDRRRPELRRLAEQGEDWGANAVAAIIANEAAYRGRIAAARDELALARRGDRLLLERGGGGWAMPMLLGVPILIDDHGQAEELIDAADRAARSSGSMLATLSVLTANAWLRARRGDLIGAEVDFSTVLALSQENAMAMLVSNIALYLIDVLLEREGAAPAAAAILSIPVPPEFLPTWSGAMLLEAQGRLRLAQGDRERGVEDLRASGRTASALDFGPVISGWRSALALALGPEAREEALALAEAELAVAKASGLARPQGVALRARGVLRARVADGIADLERSVIIFRDGPSRLEHARSLVTLGAALRRGNRPSDARSALASGLDLAVACGAERLAAEAQQELLAAGGPRRRRTDSGTESLTASELRVAKLASAGLTNVEIAQRLFVSVKTIETHLAHVYAKFGLSGSGSRWRLGGLLDTQSVG